MRVVTLPDCPHCARGVPRDVLNPAFHRLGARTRNAASVPCARLAVADHAADAPPAVGLLGLGTPYQGATRHYAPPLGR